MLRILRCGAIALRLLYEILKLIENFYETCIFLFRRLLSIVDYMIFSVKFFTSYLMSSCGSPDFGSHGSYSHLVHLNDRMNVLCPYRSSVTK